MASRSFRGEAGRPFGTVAALLCVPLTFAAVVLSRIAWKIAGSASPIGVDPGQLPRLHDYWGLLLAGEIVKVVTGGAVLLAVWTLAGPIGPRTARSHVALAIGTLGAVLWIVASRQGIVAAAHLGAPEILPYGGLVAAAARAGVACIGLWAALVALEARRAQSLPRWVQDAGLALCLTALAAAVFPPLLPLAALVSIVWWAGLFATLYRPEDRALRH